MATVNRTIDEVYNWLVAHASELLAITPPVGKCKVTNIYVDPDTGKMVVEYDTTPQE